MTEPQIHRWLCWGLIGVAALTALIVSFIDAPYGRHARAGWGPTISTRWMWVVMEAPASVGFALIFAAGRNRFEVVPLLLFGLWQLHYVHRTFIYPLRIRPDGKRTALLVALMGMLFQCVNSYINARHISEIGHYTLEWLYEPRMIIGVLLFFVGRRINHASDATLIALREQQQGYQIPHGGLFSRVSCPNYFGELLEWLGWAIATWSLPGAAFFIYACANLIPRAVAHHRWYRKRFPNYPAHRKAVIPFVI